MLKHRWNYWNNSKFADWIRGEKKPYALSMEEWQIWRNKLKNKSPFRYYVAEILLNRIQNFIYWPIDLYKSIKSYINNRFVAKTHFLKTGLKPGEYHELDERIIHGLFNELKEFVECEQASMYSYSHKDKYKFKKGRCPEAGVDYLNWAMNLKFDESCGFSENDPEYGKPTQQALSSAKILKLYNWWNNRPNRIDPMEQSGWSKYCENKPIGSKTDENGRKILDKFHKLEEEQEKEDEDMLIELIKLRKTLWT